MRPFRIDSVPALTSMMPCLLLLHGTAIAQQGPPDTEPQQDELAEIVLPGAAADTGLDSDGDWSDLPDTPPESNEDRLRSLFKLYRDAVNDRMFAEADTLAKQIVELTIETHGLDSRETARAITNLAIAQHGAEDFQSAELNFTSAIEITERISDRLNDDLINPLKGLAAAQLALGNPGAAAETFQRATHISHVNFGPHNLEQIEVLESLAETYLVAGEFEDAIQLQERIFALQARNVSADSEQLLPALLTQARWLHRLRQFDKERYTWRRMINILEEKRGKNDLSLIRPLTGLGNSYLYVSIEDTNYSQPISSATGEIYLKRAVRITENNPDADWSVKTEAILALGDYFLLTEKISRAQRSYGDAWEILSADDERRDERTEELQSLKILLDIRPPKVYGIDLQRVPTRRPDGFETGTYVYNYTVSVRGTPVNIELIEAEPAGLDSMERRVLRELRRIKHRPRVVDGKLVTTDSVRLTHDFYYRPGDLPNELDTPDGEAE